MSISTFGGAPAGASSNNAQIVVGQAMIVPSTFTAAGYVDSGATYSSTTYPGLYAAVPPSFTGDLWKQVTVPNIPSSVNIVNFGYAVNAFTFGGEYFIFFSKGLVMRTTGGISTPNIPTNFGSASATATVAWAMAAGSYIYVSLPNSTQVLIFSEITLTTIQTVSLGATGGALYVMNGNGTYFAWRQASSVTPWTCTDGLTWVTQTVPTTSPIIGMDWSGTTWLLATNGTSGSNHATSPNGTTWTAVASGIATAAAHMRWHPTGGVFVLAIAGGNGPLYSSATGAASSWTLRLTTSANIQYLDVNSNGLMIVSQASTVTYSSNSNNWVYSSTNGTTWSNNTVFAASMASTSGYGSFAAKAIFRCYGTQSVMIGSQMFSSTWVYNSTNIGQGQISVGVSNDGFNTCSNVFPMFAATGTPAVNPPVFLSNGQTGIMFDYTASTAQSSAVGSPYYSLTTNGGTTWNAPAQLPTLNASYIWSSITATPTHFIICGTSATSVQVFLSSPDGVNWTFGSSGWNGYSITTYNENIILYSSGTTACQVSTNYGQTFSPVTLSAAFTGVPAATATSLMYQTITTGVTQYAPLSQFVANGYVTVTTGACPATAAAVTSAANTCTSPKGTIVMVQNSAAPVASANYLFTADGGQSYVARTFPTAITPKGCMYTNGYFVIFISGTSYIFSSDGINWATGSIGLSGPALLPWLFMKAVNGPGYVAGAYSSVVFTPDTTTVRTPYIPATIANTKNTFRAQ
jgi:hypothetical protein